MTWVLAKSFVQDYSLIISDICVSYDDPKTYKKKYANCLLKIHDISRENGLMVGFSGRVENAFNIIDDMRILANKMALVNSDRKFDVLDFIKEWRAYTAEHIKHRYEDDENNGVHMFIAGNHTDNNSTDNKYAPCAVYQIKSPDYRPMPVNPFHWSHIGSGSGMQICKDVIDELSEDFRFRILAIDTTPEQVVEFIAPRISKVLENGLTEKGVSTRLTVGISTKGDTGLAVTYRIDDPPSKPLPKLASTYEELLEKIDKSELQAKFFA